jgi:hypothetical protein
MYLPFQYNVDSKSRLNMQKLHGTCWDSYSGDNYAYQFQWRMMTFSNWVRMRR